MRLIKITGQNHFSPMDYEEKKGPRYAVLSHTWGANNEEVTYKDLIEGTGVSKAGWQKLEFCRKQAAADGLQHFWVDTCCINKDSSAELSEAITSMFRWYHGAEKCYVYLSNVSIYEPTTEVNIPMAAMEKLLGKSRWFYRGWTLQELIAPTCVEFFSRNGDLLGTKQSLEKPIHNITGIAIEALRGRPMTDFTLEERFNWAKSRKTKRDEDEAYSMVGIFDVSMTQKYGEGKIHASRRLREEISKSLMRE